MKKKISLAWMILFLCCILVLIPVICSVVYFSRVVSKHLETTARETASFYMDQYTRETILTLDTLRSSAYYLISDRNTQGIMSLNQAPSQMERLKVEEGLSKVFLLGMVPDSNTVTGIYLVKDSRQYLSVLRSGTFQGTANRIQDVYQECGDFNSTRDLYISPSYPDYCYFIVDYIELETMASMGKIIIEINPSHFIDSSKITPIYQHAEVLMRRVSGEVIAGNLEIPFQETSLYSQDGYLTIDGVQYYRSSKSLSPNNVQLDLLIPKKEIFQTIDDTVKISILFTCIVLVLTLVVGIFLLYLLYHPFKQMMEKLDYLAAGNLSVRMDPTPYRETNQMAVAFNDMADRLNELFDEVYTKGLLLRDAEFRLLESQIRPHFIFNILELINMRCMASGQYDTCRTVSNLAQLLRSNVIHKHKQTISFEDELKYVRYYLELQKERFQEKLNYSIDLEDDEILDYYLPKLTIQPLVENSIVHGLENKREGGWVKISIWEETDSVCIRVSDNGIGFDISALNLNSSLDKDREDSHNHVALYNINRRIQLLYGREYGMKILSTSEGTNILLTLPIHKNPVEKGGVSNV